MVIIVQFRGSRSWVSVLAIAKIGRGGQNANVEIADIAG
jgi:hypothetical protein